MRMDFKVLPVTFVLCCVVFRHTLAAIDIDNQFGDNQKQNHLSIDKRNISGGNYSNLSNIFNMKSSSVPYSNSKDMNYWYYENVRKKFQLLLSISTRRPLFHLTKFVNQSYDLTKSHQKYRFKRADEKSEEDPNDTRVKIDSNYSIYNLLFNTFLENNVDDEDLTTGSADLEGSGLPGLEEPTVFFTESPPATSVYVSTISPGAIHVYRITMTIGEPYTSDYRYPHSAAFKLVQDGLTKGFNAILHDIPGYRTIFVRGIHRRPEDLFTCKVTLDLETIDNEDAADYVEYESRLRKQITDYNRIGSIQVWIHGFTFRDFKGDTEDIIIDITNIYLAMEPKEYTGPEGLNVKLKCSAPYLSTSVRKIVKWTRKDTGTLPANAYDNSNGMLTISNPSLSDSGLYTCTVTTLSGSTLASAESRVTIATDEEGLEPDNSSNDKSFYGVNVTPRNQTAPEGAQVTIECRTNDPVATIGWAKQNEEQLSPNMIASGETLVIHSIQKSDEGTYICSIQNPGGNEFQDYAIVQVQKTEPPRIRIYPNDTQVYLAGDLAYIQCVVEGGDPPPSQSWSRPDPEGNLRPVGPRVDIVPDLGLLRINNISQEDAGKYTCTAENTAGREFINAYINVYTYPVVMISPSEQVVVRTGDFLSLECSAMGTPAPTVSWAKYIRPYDRHLEPRELTETGVYRIASVRPSDAGVYVCTGKNAAGFDDKRVSVLVERRSFPVVSSPRPRGDSHGDMPSGANVEVPDVDEGEYVYAVGTSASLSCITGEMYMCSMCNLKKLVFELHFRPQR